ncbi:MAG: hypothetical protein ACFFG0_26300, partial [Candidatus Thorarchaeota archaeon]
MSENIGKFGWSSEFSDKLIEFTQPDVMVKLVSTIDSRGWPHITIITSNRAIGRNQIVWGQFLMGTSKENVQKNPKQGMLYMTAEPPFKFIQVKAKFDHSKTEGVDLEYFNRSDFMRYFTYINVYKVFYNKVISVTSIRDLPPGSIPKKTLRIIKNDAKTGLEEKRLNIIG